MFADPDILYDAGIFCDMAINKGHLAMKEIIVLAPSVAGDGRNSPVATLGTTWRTGSGNTMATSDFLAESRNMAVARMCNRKNAVWYLR